MPYKSTHTIPHCTCSRIGCGAARGETFIIDVFADSLALVICSRGEEEYGAPYGCAGQGVPSWHVRALLQDTAWSAMAAVRGSEAAGTSGEQAVGAHAS